MDEKVYTGELTVSGPLGDVPAPFTVTVKDRAEGADVKAELIVYGHDFEGNGTSLDWDDAFAELQKTLPKGYSLKCCIACRHGNMCVYGSLPNMIFCTHGEDIKDKDDVVAFLAEPKAASTVHKATDVCKSFAPQSKDFYTYNDYLYYLEGESNG